MNDESSTQSAVAEGPLSLDEIRGDVALAASRPLAEIDPARRLTGQGLDSLAVMMLAAKWGKRGLGISYSELIAEPTLNTWLKLAADRIVT
jgi:bifunctional isochorismate lyase/aryl carrier protein